VLAQNAALRMKAMPWYALNVEQSFRNCHHRPASGHRLDRQGLVQDRQDRRAKRHQVQRLREHEGLGYQKSPALHPSNKAGLVGTSPLSLDSLGASPFSLVSKV